MDANRSTQAKNSLGRQKRNKSSDIMTFVSWAETEMMHLDTSGFGVSTLTISSWINVILIPSTLPSPLPHPFQD